jgi:hypothetical protein
VQHPGVHETAGASMRAKRSEQCLSNQGSAAEHNSSKLRVERTITNEDIRKNTAAK